MAEYASIYFINDEIFLVNRFEPTICVAKKHSMTTFCLYTLVNQGKY